MAKLDGQVALVTGGARGIGLEVCRLLAGEGAQVLLAARDPSRAEAAARELGPAVRPLELDVADAASIEALPARVGPRLDVLVHNAATFSPWDELPSSADLSGARAALETNLLGPWRITQLLLPRLRESPRPRLVWVTSGAGSHGDARFGLAAGPGATSYGISKAAANALVLKLATELADTPVLVNAVDPGLTATAPGMEAMGARPPADGARSVAWAALLDDDGPRGGFFRDGEPLPW
jgi:NAD(P)-dependent dehydrogenase (short-subunit alcohol dehydrogenase family)